MLNGKCYLINMSRLILVPQYPTKLRYQEWWFTQLPIEFSKHFHEVIVLGGDLDIRAERAREGDFSPVNDSIVFETFQIREYLALSLAQDDVLLLCDISYPGFFVNVLHHKKPNKCFAICHGTSKNNLDYFFDTRYSKFPMESASAKLFDGIFVATEYHKKKLKWWGNVIVQPFPFPPFMGEGPLNKGHRHNTIVSVARQTIQKVTKTIEKAVEREYGKIVRSDCKDWWEYIFFLQNSKILLITSKEETYGYQAIDAILNGCIPVAPRRYSYPELLPDFLLYEDKEDLIVLLDWLDTNPNRNQPVLWVEEQAKNFYSNLANIMKA
jgi:hypothetical protein